MSRDADGDALNGGHRPKKYLLSGLRACGLCGGGLTIIDGKEYGCARHRSKGTRSNGHKVRRAELERRVLDGLKDRWLAPELVEDFTCAFQEEVNRQAEQSQSQAQGEGRERSGARSRA